MTALLLQFLTMKSKRIVHVRYVTLHISAHVETPRCPTLGVHKNAKE